MKIIFRSLSEIFLKTFLLHEVQTQTNDSEKVNKTGIALLGLIAISVVS